MINLEKRCINKTFPQVVTDEDYKCKNPSCKGYDKHCQQYAPTSSFDQAQLQQFQAQTNTQRRGVKY
jgi:hypothetical protein